MALIAGKYRRDEDAEQPLELLAPILEQNERIGEAYRRRHTVADVDPDTGEETELVPPPRPPLTRRHLRASERRRGCAPWGSLPASGAFEACWSAPHWRERSSRAATAGRGPSGGACQAREEGAMRFERHPRGRRNRGRGDFGLGPGSIPKGSGRLSCAFGLSRNGVGASSGARGRENRGVAVSGWPQLAAKPGDGRFWQGLDEFAPGVKAIGLRVG